MKADLIRGKWGFRHPALGAVEAPPDTDGSFDVIHLAICIAFESNTAVKSGQPGFREKAKALRPSVVFLSDDGLREGGRYERYARQVLGMAGKGPIELAVTPGKSYRQWTTQDTILGINTS